MNLLLFSNSTNYGEPYFEFPVPYIQKFLEGKPKKCLFFPYAGVTISWDDYEKRIQNKFQALGHSLISAHRVSDLHKSIKEAEVIVVGGGNTFNLLFHFQTLQLIDLIRERVQAGIPYIGWSAGSNVVCPSLCTTNDMPIIQPPTFDAFNLIPFQINPHFTEGIIPNHGGETREARILEYLEINKDKKVLGLREGSLIHYVLGKATLKGKNGARLFGYQSDLIELVSGDDITFLFN